MACGASWYEFSSLIEPQPTLTHCQLEVLRTLRHGGTGTNATEGSNSPFPTSGLEGGGLTGDGATVIMLS